MKLQERLPDAVRIGRKSYRLNLDFRNVLQFLDTLEREDLIQNARDYLALKCVMKRPPRGTEKAMEAVKALLFPDVKKGQKRPKITDYEQDADAIRAAFLQAYNINLYRDRLHWFEFCGLLSCLPEGTRYSEILSIRARPMPTPTKWNAEERKWLAQAKAELAVKLNDRERETSLADGLRGVALSLLSLAEQGGGSHA